MHDAVEQPGGIGRIGHATVAARWLTAALGKDGAVRAAAQFFLSTIARLERHRFTLALAAGVAIAWALPTAVRWHVLGNAMILTRPRDLLALPLSTMVFLLVALRIAAALPGDLRAAWIFDAAPPALKPVRTGIRRVLLSIGVAPVVVLFTPMFWWIWGWRTAIELALIAFAAGWLVTECLLASLDAMPCATPWRPERANLRTRWFVYLFAFIFIAGTAWFSLPSWEMGFAGTPAGFAILLTALAGSAMWVRRRAARQPIVPPDDELRFGIVQLNLE
jgi:hypothetical protein